MTLFQGFTVLMVLSAIFGYVNQRFLRLPTTIGLMLSALIMSLTILIIGQFVPKVFILADSLIGQVDFSSILMEMMLSFLLFAGALHMDVRTMAKEKIPIFIFSTLGVVGSTFLVGTIMYWVLMAFGLPTGYIYCLLFGALISPTDPIAVLAIIKKSNVPKNLEIKIAGESLFNDGIAVVVFLTIYEMAEIGIDKVGFADVAILFAQETLGGVLFGFILGYLGFWFMRTIDAYVVEILITLAIVMGGYNLATALHTSGPLAIVVAGLIMSDKVRTKVLSDTTRKYVDMFWEMIDEILNALLFVLIGLEMLVISFKTSYVEIGLIAIPVVLLARLISVGVPISLMRLGRSFIPNTIKILTWGGLRGGLSVALALSLSPEMPRDLIVSITYLVVSFSILVQGLTIKTMVKKLKLDNT